MTILTELVATGKITRGYLGVELASTPPAGAGVGLQVTGVLVNSPAHHAGLRVGDFILAVDEHPAISSTAVSRQIAHTTPGSQIEVKVLRDNRQIMVTAMAGERPTAGQ
jgi:S1-C subfamily serine protease